MPDLPLNPTRDALPRRELVDSVCAALEKQQLMGEYRLLQVPGLRDEAVLVHSVGCSVWTLLGARLGFNAMVEAPAPSALGAEIRSDCAWLEPSAWRPAVLVEFERYEGGTRGQSKLADKLRNLLEAAARWQVRPDLLVLSAWNAGIVSAPPTTIFAEVKRAGFRNASGAYVRGCPGTPLLFHRLIFGSSPGGLLTLDRSHCEVLP